MSDQLLHSLIKRIGILEDKCEELDRRTIGSIKLGPTVTGHEPISKETEAAIERVVKAIKPVPPVDRSAQVLTDGNPVPSDRSHTEIGKDGMQKSYVVLTAEERAKGFVMPYRDSYQHKKCGVVTKMGRAIAETYARDPSFYSGTFCVGCHAHFNLDEFTWEPYGQSMDVNKWSLAEQKELNDRIHKLT